MTTGRVDPTVRRAALAGAGAHLVYGGYDVLLATAAFCIFWRAGLALTTDRTMEDTIEQPDASDRLDRIARRARAQECATEADAPTTPQAIAPGRPGLLPEDPSAPGTDVPAIPRIGNLCREIPMPPFRLDAAACADAMLAPPLPTSRTLSAFRRARAEASYGELWAAEVHAGETMIETMTRVIAEGLPRPDAVAIVRGPGLDQMRSEFDALPSDERADEIQRHLWAMQDPSRVRTRFSPLLSAIGIC